MLQSQPTDNTPKSSLTSRSFLEELDEAFLWPCRSLYTELCRAPQNVFKTKFRDEKTAREEQTKRSKDRNDHQLHTVERTLLRRELVEWPWDWRQTSSQKKTWNIFPKRLQVYWCTHFLQIKATATISLLQSSLCFLTNHAWTTVNPNKRYTVNRAVITDISAWIRGKTETAASVFCEICWLFRTANTGFTETCGGTRKWTIHWSHFSFICRL